MSRPPLAYGIWADMIAAAGSARALADELCCSVAWLRLVSRAARNMRGPHQRLAVLFAKANGVLVRAYTHPTLSGAYIVSTAEGWWCVNPRVDGLQAWSNRRWTRMDRRHLDALPLLEVPFFRMWSECAPPENGRAVEVGHCRV